jgi:hypothetical protein
LKETAQKNDNPVPLPEHPQATVEPQSPGGSRKRFVRVLWVPYPPIMFLLDKTNSHSKQAEKD